MKRLALIGLLALSWHLLALPAGASNRETLRIGVRAISPPYSFLAVKNGKRAVRGYTVDMWEMLGKVMNVDIRFIPTGDMVKRQEMLLKGNLDVIAHGGMAAGKRLGVIFIPSGHSLRNHLYVAKTCRSVTCLRDLDCKRVVSIASAPYSTEVQIPKNALKVNSPFEALTLLNTGVVDVFIAPSELVADYLIDKHGLENVMKKGVVLGETRMGLLLSPNQNQWEGRIRAAVLYLQETGRLAQLRDKWFGKTFAESFINKYAEYVAMAAGAIGFILVAVVIWNVSLKRRVNQVALDLRRTEQRYRDLIESSPDMIFLVNESGDVLHANDRARTFLHFPEGEPVNLTSFMAREEADEIAAFLTKVYNDGCDKHEFVMQPVSGHPMEVEIAGRVIQAPLQAELLACLFARNVTERNRMEEELIQSERLGIIGKMAASVAHEINNPLGVIQANAEDLMFEEVVSEDVKEGLAAIQRNATRAGEITKGLLEAAAPRPVSDSRLDVVTLVHDSISLLGAKGKERSITVNAPDTPLYIRGDDRALQQVLVNLLFNALNSTEQDDCVAVTVSGQENPDDATVRIVVADTGKGIPRHNLTRVFEPFFTSRKGGFGLGLFITRRMVEKHGGLIYAESEEGSWTAVVLEFPSCTKEE